MNLNPLENQKCQYGMTKLYTNGEWSSLELTELGKKISGCEYGGYNTLLNSITDKIDWFIIGGHQDYQGDLFYLGKDGNDKYYFLNQGYGSCSGCDAYYASEENIEDLNELRESIKRKIIQFDSLEEFQLYLEGDMIKGNYYYHDEDFHDFINKLNEKLNWNIKIDKEEY